VKNPGRDFGEITDVAKFLYDTGLLFSINNQVLHPLGLALSVIVEEGGSISGFGPLWNCTDDPEGIYFGPEAFFDGLGKLHQYLKTRGGAEKIYNQRLEKLGYVIQPPQRGQNG